MTKKKTGKEEEKICKMVDVIHSDREKKNNIMKIL